jgi:hypothetical protein
MRVMGCGRLHPTTEGDDADQGTIADAESFDPDTPLVRM